jgi:hypothetical protein
MVGSKCPLNITFFDQKVARRGFAQYSVTTVPDPRAVRGMNVQCNIPGCRTPAVTTCSSQVATTPVQTAVSMYVEWPIPVAARFKAWVCGRSLAGIVGSNPAGGMDVCLL